MGTIKESEKKKIKARHKNVNNHDARPIQSNPFVWK